MPLLVLGQRAGGVGAQLSPAGQIVCIVRSTSPGETVEGCSGGGANSFADRGDIIDGIGADGIIGAGDIPGGMGRGATITGAPGVGRRTCAFADSADRHTNMATNKNRMTPLIGWTIVNHRARIAATTWPSEAMGHL